MTQTAVNETVACETTTVSGGAFEFQLGDVLQPGVGHRIDAFVDVDGDQRCEFGVDAVMSLDIAPTTEAYDLTFPAGNLRIGDDPRGCAGFGGTSFRIAVSGVTKGVVRYALVRLNEAGASVDKVITVGNAIVAGGQAVLALEGAGQGGRFYRIEFFEADDFDGACGGETAAFRLSMGAVGQDGPSVCGVAVGGIEFEGSIATSGAFETGDCSSFTP
jgi:hypothetical protein